MLKDMKVFTQKNYQDHVPCTFAYKVVCIDDRFTKPIVAFRGENSAYEIIKAILKEFEYCKKVIWKHFNKSLVINEEDKYLFQQSNSCWICEKLIGNDEEKVRDHCHVTEKLRRAAHWSCKINLPLTKKVPIIFHDLRSYDSHLIFCELKNFNVKTSVIPNGLEKYMTFFLNKNLVFIDRMQFMNSSLDKLVEHVLVEDFKYLVEEFGYENLFMSAWTVLRDLREKLAARKCVFSSTKKEKLMMMVRNQMVT